MARLSIVLPAHNSGTRLARSLERLQREASNSEIEAIIVENGSRDNTWQQAQQLSHQDWGFTVQAYQSAVGLGAAYHEGIRRARGDVVLLTADDLPFGCSDLRSWERLNQPDALVIGSKAHRGSQVERGVLRSSLSLGYRAMRWISLGMRVADCQGTIFAPRAWLLDNLARFRELGYLSSTEIVYAAQLQHIDIVEVAVQLMPRDSSDRSRIKLTDITSMAAGLIRLRSRAGELRGQAQ